MYVVTYEQYTLGALVRVLDALGTVEVEALEGPHSYRGYYDELAFQPPTRRLPANKVAAIVRDVYGQSFEGWKGGQYTYGDLTPVWIATKGTDYNSGRLAGPTDDGQWVVMVET